MKRVTTEQVLQLHRMLIEQTGGLDKIRDISLLESAYMHLLLIMYDASCNSIIHLPLYHRKFYPYIFQFLIHGFWIAWPQKSKEYILFVFPVLVPQKHL